MKAHTRTSRTIKATERGLPSALRRRFRLSFEADVLAVLFFFFLPAYISFRSSSQIGLLLYVFPPMFVALCYAQKGVQRDKSALFLLGSFALIAIISLARGTADLPEILFVGLSIALFPFYIKLDFRPYRLAALSGLGYLLLNPSSAYRDIVGGSFVSVYSVDIVNDSLEAALALIFGPAVLASIHYRDWRYAIINLVFLALLSKRIAMIALLAGVALYVADSVMRDRLRKSRVFSGTLVVSLALFGLNFPEVLDWVKREFNLHVNLNLMTSGRYVVQHLFHRYMESHTDVLDVIYGHGVGAHHVALANSIGIRTSNFALLHDDWLRIFYDYGIVGLIAALLVFLKSSRRSRLHFAIAGYTAVAFVTGNAFGYVFYWIAVWMMLPLPAEREVIGGRTARSGDEISTATTD